jgi:hypothetical protein
MALEGGGLVFSSQRPKCSRIFRITSAWDLLMKDKWRINGDKWGQSKIKNLELIA